MSNMHIEGLFPIPVMRVEKVFNDSELDALQDVIDSSPKIANAKTDLLTHTEPLGSNDIDQLGDLNERLQDYFRDFGFLLFGENLRWTIKELWMNVSVTGGAQLIHTHANSLITAVIYLTDVHPSARIIFHKPMGGTNFVFSNSHENSTTTPYNAERWMPDEVNRGDMVFFPSHLLHAVPPNQGDQTRISIAMNALPERLKSWDYEVQFAN
ncbi:MAG: 2OG-Fe(II) oxygenase family protein [Candidatus Thiodiazotropha lotti]|uniref:TIGR02466 family protein n=1 Tax=Candidatus Thiodiazotropha endoloripes TaxID=1818881 RepID=UPI0009F549D8|nr:TIGR02466 family protein [Candidatus Thiodiazotropha endoloripes]MCG7990850.1 2OG-Fe(II) oxygenase family protein [Candidatus Thiodiazotropha lotti]MCG7999286.1 2OG-Fe(II) oxygenase family protein [Candidatus Thiodiazotropha lotti]MCW4182504.1 2OG-Fe(II) oxygenase family protein [Candidatus Thiodiazotropha weberae]MCW4191054.1 2OG-Fe(II) oxygenase family protein [Candidatus Thiodiazotropha weberae]